LPCCAANKAGDRFGDRLTLVVGGSGADAIFPFIERGWWLDEPLDIHSMLRTIRAFVFGTEYTTAPVSPLFVFGRPQNIALQEARTKSACAIICARGAHPSPLTGRTSGWAKPVVTSAPS
jgi:hypothetical protein